MDGGAWIPVHPFCLWAEQRAPVQLKESIGCCSGEHGLRLCGALRQRSCMHTEVTIAPSSAGTLDSVEHRVSAPLPYYTHTRTWDLSLLRLQVQDTVHTSSAITRINDTSQLWSSASTKAELLCSDAYTAELLPRRPTPRYEHELREYSTITDDQSYTLTHNPR